MTVFEDGTQKDRILGRPGPLGRVQLSAAPARSQYAQVDPDNVFLIDRDLSNNSFVVKARMAGAMRWSGKLLFWMQNLLQFASALS